MAGRRHRDHRPAEPWSRRKMLTLLAAAGLGVLAVGAGLVLAVAYALAPPPLAADSHRGTAAPSRLPVGGLVPAGQPADPRDVLAGRPMTPVGADAAHPGPVSARDPGPDISLPAATGTGPAQVPTGFGHSPAGALAQLAAIDTTAVQSGSLAGARQVIAGWALPGGPTPASSSLVHALTALFDSTGLPGGGSPRLTVVLTPLMGQIKGSVGGDFVVPCVDFELEITLAQTGRGAVADCQRMVWSGGRWMIGAGPEPAPAPSVWPDTDLAIAVGYHDLRQQQAGQPPDSQQLGQRPGEGSGRG